MNAASGRRLLWELDGECHGPLLGSCWSAAQLRQLSDKLFGGRSSLDDFELHAAAVTQCATRNKLSLALQRQLDREAAPWLHRAAAAASAEVLQALWNEALRGGEIGPALWAVWGDARCDEALRARLHKDLYLLQHERIATWPAERAAGLALQDQTQRLQQRHARWRSEALAERDALRAQLARSREHAAALQAQLDRLRQAAPVPADLPAGRAALVQQVAALTLQLAQLQRADDAPVAPPPAVSSTGAEVAMPPAPLSPDALCATQVLCVGGRSGHVPLYREFVERHGGRFAHHDGGIEDNPHRLDAQLAAADLVVCQSGCLNHNAYSRVKDHCKRSGKPCVYLDKPGAGSFARALSAAREMAAP